MEKCTVDDIDLKITGNDAEKAKQVINEYLSVFAKPVPRDGDGLLFGKHACLKCGEPLSGACGTFKWSLAHGEGACSKCAWPARAYHRPQYKEEELFTGPLVFVLQYHPEHVTTDER